MNQPNGYDKLIGMAVFGLGMWGFIYLGGVRPEVLRAHPFSSLLWLVALSSLASAADAVEHRRPWGMRAVVVMIVAGLLTVLANVLEWFLFGVDDHFLPMVPPVSSWMAFILVALVFRVLDQQKAMRRPIPRPAPHP